MNRVLRPFQGLDEIAFGMPMSQVQAMHIKELGVMLLSFHRPGRHRRELWYYSKDMMPEFENFLDVV